MTTTQQAAVTFQMSWDVVDPDALLAWAPAPADRSTEGWPAGWREATRALVADIPGALRWANQAKPDTDPPGFTVTARALDVQAAAAASR